MRSLRSAAAAMTGVICLALLAPASARSYKVLYTFCASGGDCQDGQNPSGGLVRDAAGNLYGVTTHGGSTSDCIQFCGYGVAYKLQRTGKGEYQYEVLYNFCTADSGCTDGADPGGSLIFDTAGDLYGVTAFGGSGDLGTIFELVPNGDHWTEQVLYSFCPDDEDGCAALPSGDLTYKGAASGKPYDGTSPLFGVASTDSGGEFGPPGVAWKFQPGEGYQTIHTFGDPQGSDGSQPVAPLIEDSAGNLYGTTLEGGSESEGGTVIELSPSAGTYSETILYAFCANFDCSDGYEPQAGLVLDAAGNLYGTTYEGGQSCSAAGKLGCGVAFMIEPNGTNSRETVLHDFCSSKDCADGGFPAATLLADSRGNFFGTAEIGGNKLSPYGGGVLFELSGTRLRALYKFCTGGVYYDCPDGVHPGIGVIEDKKSPLFGASAYGGAGQTESYDGNGVVYEETP
jgi:uncharacterized repeat protein (TIGR03803 family)